VNINLHLLQYKGKKKIGREESVIAQSICDWRRGGKKGERERAGKALSLSCEHAEGGEGGVA